MITRLKPCLNDRSFWYLVAVGLIVVFGLYLRISWSLNFYPDGRKWFPDEYNYYVSTAESAFNDKGFVPEYNNMPELSKGGVFVPPPLQPLFLLAVYRAFGEITNPVVPKIIQIFFSTIAIFLCAEIGRRLISRLAGIVFAFLFAIYPEFVFWTEILQTESNFLSILVAIIFLLILWAKQGSGRIALCTSMLLGLLCLQRGTALLLGPSLAIAALLFFRNKRGFVSAVFFSIVPLCVIAPWFFRNLIVYGEPVIISSNTGVVFHISNNIHLNPLKEPYAFTNVFRSISENKDPSYIVPEIEQKYRMYDAEKAYINRDLKTSWYVYSKPYSRFFLSYVAQHPLHFVKNLALKTYNQFWLIQKPTRISVPIFRSMIAFGILHRLLLVGGCVGLVLLLRRKKTVEMYIVLAVFMYFIVIGSLFTLTLDGRYNLYLKLFLMLYCGGALSVLGTSLWNKIHPR